MPQRAKARLGRPKPRRLGEVEKPEVPEQPEEDPKEALSFNAEQRLEFYAMLAWLPDYSAVYDMEAEINGATAMVDSYTSGYRRRQMAAAAAAHDERALHAVRALAADSRRQGGTAAARAAQNFVG